MGKDLFSDDPKHRGKDPDMDPLEFLLDKWGVQTGDLWTISGKNSDPHLLLCGDSTKRENFLSCFGPIHAVITDPPYGISKGESRVQTWGGKEVLSFDFLPWDEEAPDPIWYENAAGALSPGGTFFSFCDSKALTVVWDFYKKAGLNPLQFFFWEKNNPPPQPRKNFQSAVETAVFGRRPGRVHFWGGGGVTHNLIRCPLTPPSQKVFKGHPTQKPIRLLMDLVPLFTQPGDRILDTFLGSGSLMEACERLGRVCVGIEREPEFVALVLEKLSRMGLSCQK